MIRTHLNFRACNRFLSSVSQVNNEADMLLTNFSGVRRNQMDFREADKFGRGVEIRLGWSPRKPLILRGIYGSTTCFLRVRRLFFFYREMRRFTAIFIITNLYFIKWDNFVLTTSSRCRWQNFEKVFKVMKYQFYK